MVTRMADHLLGEGTQYCDKEIKKLLAGPDANTLRVAFIKCDNAARLEAMILQYVKKSNGHLPPWNKQSANIPATPPRFCIIIRNDINHSFFSNQI